MTTRRAFLVEAAGAVAGLAFVGCDLLKARPAAAQTARRMVSVAGRRVKTIDVHAHAAVPEAMTLMSPPASPPGLLPKLLMGAPQERLAVMDAQGIDVQALSINPYWYKADRDVATRCADAERAARGVLRGEPGAFRGLRQRRAADPDLAAAQLEEGVKKLRAARRRHRGQRRRRGARRPEFHPFWAKAEELGVLVFIHPQGAPELTASGRLKGNGWLDNVIGNPLETTIALSHLIFEGTLDRFPGLKICAAHGGGFLPLVRGPLRRRLPGRPGPVRRTAQKKPTEYLRQLYYDSIVFTPEALRHLGGRDRQRPDRHGHRLSLSLDEHVGEPHPRTPGFSRRRARGDAG